MMKFSVLLSIYQKEQPLFFQQSLDSIFSQTLLPNEIVLVKDGPLTDELNQIIDLYCHIHPIIRLVILEENQGLGRALNEGLKNCSNDIIARMDTDDIAKPIRFEKQIQIFQKYPEVDVVGSWIDEFENDISNIVSTRILPEYHKSIFKYAKQRCPINHPVVMFKKKAILLAGGYMHFPFFEDYYLWIRLLINGAQFYNVQESLLYFRFSPNMFKRRGGISYASIELKFEQKLLEMNFITRSIFIKNVIIRFISRIIPNKIRIVIYKKLLR